MCSFETLSAAILFPERGETHKLSFRPVCAVVRGAPCWVNVQLAPRAFIWNAQVTVPLQAAVPRRVNKGAEPCSGSPGLSMPWNTPGRHVPLEERGDREKGRELENS